MYVVSLIPPCQVGCVSDLLKSVKSLLVRCSLWDMVTTVDNLRLETTIRMLNIAHFNAKMNALKEVGTFNSRCTDDLNYTVVIEHVTHILIRLHYSYVHAYLPSLPSPPPPFPFPPLPSPPPSPPLPSPPLYQVVRLTDEPYQAATRGVKSPIPADKITDWLVDNKVLSIALGGT